MNASGLGTILAFKAGHKPFLDVPLRLSEYSKEAMAPRATMLELKDQTRAIPKPRWFTIEAFRFGIPIPEGAPVSTQERAYSSPIWYTPK